MSASERAGNIAFIHLDETHFVEFAIFARKNAIVTHATQKQNVRLEGKWIRVTAGQRGSGVLAR